MRKLSNFNSAFDFTSSAVGKGIDRLNSLFSDTMDEDVKLYQDLNAEDFSKLSEKYGAENVIDFIKTMEIRRMGVKKYGATFKELSSKNNHFW